MALGAQILPPTVGCDDPHEELKGEGSALRALKQGELFSTSASLRAGVSAMGFGGINTHVLLKLYTMIAASLSPLRTRAAHHCAGTPSCFSSAPQIPVNLRIKSNVCSRTPNAFRVAELTDLLYACSRRFVRFRGVRQWWRPARQNFDPA
jgi:hypothetical protein